MRGLALLLVCASAGLSVACSATSREHANAAAPLRVFTDPEPPLGPRAAPARPLEPVATPRPDLSDGDIAAVVAIDGEIEHGRWSHAAMGRVHRVLKRRGTADAERILRLAELSDETTKILGQRFSAPDAIYDRKIGDLTLLTLSFLKVGVDDWNLTPESKELLDLPFHPKLPSPLAPPPDLGAARGAYEHCDGMGVLRFISGVVAPALRCTLTFREHRFAILASTDLLRDDESIFERVDGALSIVPGEHLALVRQIVLDPGSHPRAAAMTSFDGTVIVMFLAGAGKSVPQAQLNEVTAHEVGHVVSLQQGDGLFLLWDDAIAKDGHFPSSYALTNDREDFAEAYELYLAGGRADESVRARFPQRFALLDHMFAAP